MSEIKLPEDLNGIHVHFVGIKGTGMAALVEIFFHKGAVITGSDVSEKFYTDEILAKLNLQALSFSEENITDEVQYVVYSSAYKLNVNPDLIAAVKKGVPCLLYTEALGMYSSLAYSCGICGVHGKTSTTGLTGTILKELPLPSQTLAGSIIKSFGDTCTFTSPLLAESKKGENIFVAETCEYQRHFMSFHPEKIILTSVEPDHQDYYPTYEDIRDAFVDYACLLPSGGDLIFCADDEGACEVSRIVSSKRKDINLIPYGTKADGAFCLSFTGVENEENRFNVSGLGDFVLKVPGKHEVMDACAAVALCARLLEKYGKNPSDYKGEIAKGLVNFAGGKRRSEKIGEFKNKYGKSVLVIDDYGHHPTAVKTTLDGFREFYKGRKIIVDFMSHTYSRTQALLSEFAQSFGSADSVILHKIYSSARENPADFNITGRTLFEETLKYKTDVNYFEEILDAKDFAVEEVNKALDEKYPDGYLFVTMGAGDNWKLGKALLDE
ncbi:MAG: UDP-N-acetylmuramate--L-alanine ligase [Treponema sp.]|nr:UDP-N-acetylmuramate--L-alanine ligase [Treponema sp.]